MAWKAVLASTAAVLGIALVVVGLVLGGVMLHERTEKCKPVAVKYGGADYNYLTEEVDHYTHEVLERPPGC